MYPSILIVPLLTGGSLRGGSYAFLLLRQSRPRGTEEAVRRGIRARRNKRTSDAQTDVLLACRKVGAVQMLSTSNIKCMYPSIFIVLLLTGLLHGGSYAFLLLQQSRPRGTEEAVRSGIRARSERTFLRCTDSCATGMQKSRGRVRCE